MKRTIAASTLAALMSVTLLTGQTKITPPSNKYSPADDVKLGRDAAAEARQQLPIMRDEQVTSYISDLGRKLVSAIPQELRQPLFRYTFETVNVRDINAFALPGGPMFVNRGMIEAAKNEGEVVGVMAHELSHVILRHGTAQAGKQTPYAIGGIAGAIVGAIVGGNVGRVISEGSQFGVGVAFMRYGREYEKQADLEGAQIMAAAGWDPRDMANMFKTIEEQGGSGGPEFMSDHPNPGNRYDYITKEAQALKVSNAIRNTRGFDDVRAHLRSLPKAPTTAEATKKGRPTGTSGEPNERPTGRVEAPSTRYVRYTEGNVFQISVPQNWQEVPSGNSVTFAPGGAFGRYNGQNVFTHGVEVGISRNESRDLQTATEELVEALRESNPRMSRPTSYRQGTVDGRRALQTTAVDNVSDATGERETIQITTTSTRSGDLMYAITVAPRDEYSSYQPVFQRVLSSVRFID